MQFNSNGFDAPLLQYHYPCQWNNIPHFRISIAQCRCVWNFSVRSFLQILPNYQIGDDGVNWKQCLCWFKMWCNHICTRIHMTMTYMASFYICVSRTVHCTSERQLEITTPMMNYLNSKCTYIAWKLVVFWVLSIYALRGRESELRLCRKLTFNIYEF